MLIHSGKETEFFYNKGNSDYLLVTFNEIALLADGTSYWGKPMIEQNGISAIGVVSRKPNFFMPRDDIDEFLARHGDLIRNFKGDIVLMGHSMGAFGAIKFSKAFGADTVIASCPIYSLNRSVRRSPVRPTEPFYIPELHDDMHPKLGELSGRIFYLYDPWHPWSKSPARFQEIGYPDLHFIKLPFTDHETIKVFAADDLMLKLIEKARRGDAAELQKFASDRRRKWKLRLQIDTAKRALRNPKSAWRIYEGHQDAFSAAYMLLLSRALADRMPREAERIARRMTEIAPNFVPGQKQLASLHAQRNRLTELSPPDRAS